MTRPTAFILRPGELTLGDLRRLAAGPVEVTLDPAAWPKIEAALRMIESAVAENRRAYGVNTGFGPLSATTIRGDQLGELQRRLVLSHCVGTGPLLPDPVVRLILLLKLNTLALARSGVRPALVEAMLKLVNAGVHPCIPAKGSVGASGDLAPLAHLAAALIGVGETRVDGMILPAREGLRRADLAPLELGPKEGLAMVNGTQVSTGLALAGLFGAENLLAAAVVAGALSTEAARGSAMPFDPRIQTVRGQRGQMAVAGVYKELLSGSEILASRAGSERVQDPYSLRCQPQVMGACLDLLHVAADIFGREINGVSDNPLVFAESGEILYGGNFHGQPVAMAADVLALAVAEVGSIAERRIALLTDASMSGLPAFLVADPGVNSGFMAAQVAAAALASENKALAHPSSIDSLPTAANLEDHVSMATYAARRLGDMVDNATSIVAIELLAACQGVEFRRPLRCGPALEEAVAAVRARAPAFAQDRYFHPDIDAVRELVASGHFRRLMPPWIPPIDRAGDAA